MKKKRKTKNACSRPDGYGLSKKEMLKLIGTLQTISKASNQNLFSIIELWFKRNDGKAEFLSFLEELVALPIKTWEKRLKALVS